MDNPYFTNQQTVKPDVEGRLLLELRGGHLTVYPVTNTDEETRVLLAAVLDHIRLAINRDKAA